MVRNSAAAVVIEGNASAGSFEPCVALGSHVFLLFLPTVATNLPSYSGKRGSAALVFSHSCTMLQLASGSNSVIADAVSVVVLPKSFWSNTPSWFMMNVITPELPYSAG